MFFEDSQTIEIRESCSSIVPKKNVTTTFNVKNLPLGNNQLDPYSASEPDPTPHFN